MLPIGLLAVPVLKRSGSNVLSVLHSIEMNAAHPLVGVLDGIMQRVGHSCRCNDSTSRCSQYIVFYGRASVKEDDVCSDD
jgi:hypothetical protein